MKWVVPPARKAAYLEVRRLPAGLPRRLANRPAAPPAPRLAPRLGTAQPRHLDPGGIPATHDWIRRVDEE